MYKTSMEERKDVEYEGKSFSEVSLMQAAFRQLHNALKAVARGAIRWACC